MALNAPIKKWLFHPFMNTDQSITEHIGYYCPTPKNVKSAVSFLHSDGITESQSKRLQKVYIQAPGQIPLVRADNPNTPPGGDCFKYGLGRTLDFCLRICTNPVRSSEFNIKKIHTTMAIRYSPMRNAIWGSKRNLEGIYPIGGNSDAPWKHDCWF